MTGPDTIQDRLDHARDQVRRLIAQDDAQALAHDRWHSSAERRQLRRQIQYWQGEINRLRRELGEAA